MLESKSPLHIAGLVWRVLHIPEMLRDFRPTKDLVMVIQRARGALPTHMPMLRRLSVSGAPALRQAEAHYQTSADILMLVLRYFMDGLDAIGLGMIHHIAGAIDAELIDPDQATEAEQSALAHIKLADVHANGEDVAKVIEEIAERFDVSVKGARSDLEDLNLPPPASAPRHSVSAVRVRPAASIMSPASGQIPKIASESQPAPESNHRTRAAHLSPSPSLVDEPEPVTRPVVRYTLPPRAETTRDLTSVDVRYLRSGRWAPARLRAVSLKGAYLITGGLLRVGDSAHIALALRDQGTVVRGQVFHVTTGEDIQTTGLSGFAVRFDLDDSARTQLTELLASAKLAGITLGSPPPRTAIRLPVAWPIKLRARNSRLTGQALDVSMEGMFVRPDHAIACGTSVDFSTVLDTGGPQISGRCQVVREINVADAKKRGLPPGLGLRIEEMSEDDRAQWAAFLRRVRTRVEKRVVVGASAGRNTEICNVLSAAGYAIVSGTDAASLIRVADDEIRPPDVALIDADLSGTDQPSVVAGVFRRLHVPVLMFRGDPERARPMVDLTLRV